MTFSIVGRCEKTGQLGITISSSSIGVGTRCPWVRAGVGCAGCEGGAGDGPGGADRGGRGGFGDGESAGGH